MSEVATALANRPSAYRSLAESLPVAVAVRNAEGKLVWANRRWSELSQMPLSASVGQSWTRIVHPQDRERVAEGWERLLRGEDVAEVGYGLQVSGDNSLRVRSIWLAVRGGRQELARVIEVTNEHFPPGRAFAELARSEQRYLQLLAAVTSYRYTVRVQDGQPVATEHSQGCLAATGYAPHEYMSDPGLWIGMVWPDDRERVRDHVARVLRNERVPPLEHRIVRKDGVVRWVRDTIVSHEDERGHLVRYDGLVEDITDRKQAEERCKRILESAPDAMVIVDPRGRIVLVNSQTERVFGYPRADLIGKPVETLIPERFRGQHVQMREAFSAAPSFRAMSHRPTLCGLRVDGSEFPAEISLSPIEYDGGIYVSAAIRDVSERQRVQNELATNYQIQSVISALLRLSLEPISLPAQLQRSLELLFSISWIGLEAKGAIFLLDSDAGELRLAAERGLPEALRVACARVPLGTCLCGRAAATHEVVFAEHVDDHHTTLYAGIEPHGHYCVPILLEGRLLGVLNVYVEPGHRPRPEESRFLTAVADVLAGAIRQKQTEQSLREREAQLIAARRIQEHLRPQAAPNVPGLELAGASFAAEYTAGDYYDYLQMADGTLGIVIGDVSGHGFSTGLLMATVSARLRSLAEATADLSEIFTRANAALVRETEAGRFVTLMLVRYDPRRRTIEYVSAGHPAAHVLDAAGDTKAVLKSTAPPLGIDAEVAFQRGASVQLDAGDVVLLVTDGVLEARAPDGEMFGDERAREILAAARQHSPQEIIDRLHAAVCEFSGTSELRDDLTAVVLKVKQG